MATYNLPNGTNSGDPVALLNYAAGEISILVPSVLFMIYITIALTGFLAEQRRKGEGNFALWSAIAGMITTTGAFFLALTPFVIVDVFTLTILVTVSIISTLFALFTRNA